MFQLFYLLKGQSCPWASCHMGKFKDLKLQPTVCLDFFPSSVLPFIFLLSFHLLIVVCNTVYIKKVYSLWQYTNGMDWHYLFSFSYISRACLKNALRKMCVQFPATNKLPYHTPNVNYIPDRYSQEISLTCLKNNNFFISGKNLDGFF